MSVELATAFVSLVPSTKGIAAQVRKEVGGPLESVANDAGKNAGRGFARNLASSASTSLDNLGGRIVSGLGTAFKVGAAAVAGGIATTIGLGLSRLVGIDEAEGKLRGLGHTAAGIETIMDSALASVRGTAFGLAEAATTAAGAVAAGIEPGQQLTKYLTLTADAATIAGISMDEMGSIINKVTTSGRAMTDNLNQLADRGIPIFQWLQEEYGASAEELSEMVSSGQVDAETFRKVIEENIGGAALESGNTVRGAFKNMGAALGRLGAAIATPIFDRAGGVFGNLTDRIDNLTDRVGPLAEAVGRWLATAFDRVGSAIGAVVAEGRWLASLFADAARGMEMAAVEASPLERIVVALGRAFGAVRDFIVEHRDEIGRVARALGPAIVAVGALAAGIHLVRRAFSLLFRTGPLALITAIATGLVYAWQNSETFRNIVIGAFEAVQRFIEGPVMTAFGVLKTWWDENGAGIATTIREELLGAFDSIKDWWDENGESITGPMVTFRDAIVDVVDKVKTTWQEFVEAFEGNTPQWQERFDSFGTVSAGIADAMERIAAVLDRLTGKQDEQSGSLDRAGVKLSENEQAVRNWGAAIETALGFLVDWQLFQLRIVGGVMGAVASVLEFAERQIQLLQLIVIHFRRNWNDFTADIESARETFDNIFGPAINALRRGQVTWDLLLISLGVKFREWASGVKDEVNELQTALLARFIVIGIRLNQRAKEIRDDVIARFGELTAGAREKIDDLIALASEIGSRFLKGLGDVSTILYDAGVDLVQGLIDGVRSRLGILSTLFLESVPGFIRGPFEKALGIKSPSRVFEGYGKSLGEGLAEGMAGTSRLVTAATRDLALAAQAEVEPILSSMVSPSALAVRATPPSESDGVGDGPLNVAHLEVNYPAPEPVGRSVRDGLMDASFLLGRG